MSQYPYPRTKTRWLTYNRMTWVGLALAWMILIFLVSWQLSPSVIEQRRDSGIFAYTGKIVLHGGLPYVDAWDNKLPGIYYINALAFLVFGTNRWALWLSENLVLFTTSMSLFWMMRHVYPRLIEALTGPLVLVMLTRHPALISDTNFTEPYALLPQVLVFAAGYKFLREPRSRWAFAIGFAAGAALLIKQTTIGVALTFIPAVLLTRHPVLGTRRRWHSLGVIVLGGLSCLGLVAIFLAANGILDDAVEASFVAASAFHHWVGNESSWIGATVITTFTHSEAPLVLIPLSPFLFTGMLVAWRRFRAGPSADRKEATESTLIVWAALTFFADLGLVNVTNRGFAHYYVTMIPAITLLIVFSLPQIAQWAAASQGRKHKMWKAARVYLLLLLVGVPVLATVTRVAMAQLGITGPQRQQEVVDYVADNTNPTDTVLVWGANTVVNFLADRNSPTQFTYGYPLVVPDETTDEMIHELIKDLETNRPSIIVDSALQDGLRVPPLDPVRREEWYAEGGRRDVANLEPVYRFVDRYCKVVHTFDDQQIAIYHCLYPLSEDLPLKVVLDPPLRELFSIGDSVLRDYEARFTDAYNQAVEELH